MVVAARDPTGRRRERTDDMYIGIGTLLVIIILLIILL